MTLQEAISDPNRPLSITPKEWMEYEEASEAEENDLYVKEADRIYAEENDIPDEESGDMSLSSDDRLDVGLRQMMIGCRIAIRALQDISRENKTSAERAFYDKAQDAVFNGVAPYLADALEAVSLLARLEMPEEKNVDKKD